MHHTPSGWPDPAHLVWPRHLDDVTLRLLQPGDVDDVWAYRSRPEVCVHLTHEPLSRTETAERITARLPSAETSAPALTRGLAVLINGHLVGDAVMTSQPDETSAQLTIGYALHPQAWGRGIGTATARLLADAGHELGHDVHAHVQADNTASLTALRKAGFVPTTSNDTHPAKHHLISRVTPHR